MESDMSLLGAAELPLAILLWFSVVAAVLVIVERALTVFVKFVMDRRTARFKEDYRRKY
jgi:hypothetical protein